eukprot:4945642-Pyramimonas_sp.AAC.1
MLWDIASVHNATWQYVVVFNGRVTGRPRCRICRDGALVTTEEARFNDVARIVKSNYAQKSRFQ